MKHLKFVCFLVSLFTITLSAQTEIKGKVVDDTGFPLPGASVVVKETSKVAIADIDGNYTIIIQKSPATLLFSYIGFKTKEVTVTNQKTVNVTLEKDEQALDEVILIGYGEVSKKDATGAISTLKPQEDIVAQSQTVEQLIQGRAAGVQVSANGFEPGAPISIKIRGLNSLTGNTEPLYVIDGIIVDSATEDAADPLSGGNSYLAPQGGITGVNPRDIADIQILKDASATAIYGSRGANGVVLITTKKGRSGKTDFTYNVSTRIGTITNNIDVLNTEEYVQYQNDVRANQGFSPRYYTYPDGSIANFQNDEQFMIDNAATIARIQGVDWSDDIYRASTITNHRFSASGGSEKNTFYISGGFLNNEGIVPRSFVRRVDFNANLTNQLSDKFKLSTKFAAAFTKNSASKGTDNLGGTNNNLIRQIVSAAPILEFEDNFDGFEFNQAIDGPRAWISDYDDISKELRLLGSMRLDYRISDVFTYRTTVGVDYRKKDRQVWYGNGLFRGERSNGEAGISTLDRFRYNIDNTLLFKYKFNKSHRINGTLGFIVDQRKSTNTTNSATDFPLQDLRADGISTGQNQQPVFYNENPESLLSYLGRINYTYKNRYIFTGTFRADGSSKFTDGNKWGYFPALAFAWRIDKEKFLRKSKLISNAKLRLGWGMTGNQAIPNFSTLTRFNITQTPYSDASGGQLTSIVPQNLRNTGLSWETTSQYNAGLDFGFLEDRIVGSVDVYYKEIYDLLLNVSLPGSVGFENYIANQGDLINKGIELSINADIIKNDNFRWNVYGNISFNRNEVGDIGFAPSSFGTETYSAYLGRRVSAGNFFKAEANIFIEGEAPGLFYGYATNGIISTDEELANASSFNGIAPQLGDVNLVDQNGDGIIDATDLTIIGDPNPDFNYGFGTSIEYKNFSLTALFNGVYGNDIANGNLLRDGYADHLFTNVRTEAYYNAWSVDNPNGSFPRVGYDLADDTGFTDRIVEDGSFLRLANVALGYNVPVKENGFIKNAYISISGQNLLLFTKYSGFDPEVNSFSFDPSRVGIDWNSFPNQRSYSLSLNLTF